MTLLGDLLISFPSSQRLSLHSGQTLLGGSQIGDAGGCVLVETFEMSAPALAPHFQPSLYYPNKWIQFPNLSAPPPIFTNIAEEFVFLVYLFA